MYQKAYGIIETLAPLHVGATAGEESGNLNLIFRDQFTQTGIIPGSSIRGRFRSEMRTNQGQAAANKWYGNEADLDDDMDSDLEEKTNDNQKTTESLVKFEYASIVWLPVFCPGQPVVWVSCPRLLKRYKRIAGITETIPNLYTASQKIEAIEVERKKSLFFNFGFLEIKKNEDLTTWFPLGEQLPAVVVDDNEISLVHDMALYRQSRVRLEKEQKKVDKGGFFNTEALPEGTILVFPIALRKEKNGATWQPFNNGDSSADLYLGGLESIGFGHCSVTLKGVE